MEKFDLCSETERLVIRPLKVGDYENWLGEYEKRAPRKHRYDFGKIDMIECTYEWFNELVANHQRLAKEDVAHVFSVFRKEDGVHIGMVDFSTLDRENFNWARIGYTFHNQHFRHGYGKEAVKEALNMAFKELKFNRIEAHIYSDNEASIGLAMKVGMAFECVKKDFIFEDNKWNDNVVYYIHRH
ncbi:MULTISPECIES: GNAT family N-acetyltransferase [Pontibacillus]|uniref:GNAT family N-acetyltransferase n=1 Tax=Pontibacillus chungwhensis TaxID=265426 RepID=A0ABY8V2K2_9BACI|nr:MULTISPECIES: GNAT family N-acetyltransferase [Pontibacillus]MCD5324481.1 GNAT family N-acetyltransferase [Pontibacillus sp. HN14]WIF99226.1 GNAT family N-acetyltransferase [Pontibacillus chungwhensis]